jgi:hypothetical protein
MRSLVVYSIYCKGNECSIVVTCESYDSLKWTPGGYKFGVPFGVYPHNFGVRDAGTRHKGIAGY